MPLSKLYAEQRRNVARTTAWYESRDATFRTTAWYAEPSCSVAHDGVRGTVW